MEVLCGVTVDIICSKRAVSLSIVLVSSLYILAACSSGSNPPADQQESPISNPTDTQEPETAAGMALVSPISVEVGLPGNRPSYVDANVFTSTVTAKFSHGLSITDDQATYFNYANTFRSVGDIDCDGLQDGMSTTTGEAYNEYYPTASTAILGSPGGWPERTSLSQESRLLDNEQWAPLHDLVYLGDINGDGRSDIGAVALINSSPAHEDAELNLDAWVILNAEDVLRAAESPLIDGNDRFRIINTETSAEVSGRVIKELHPLGDVNGDGLADILVEYAIKSTHPANTADMYLIFGSRDFNIDTLDVHDPAANAIAIHVGESLPWQPNQIDVGVPSDYNGDGIDDMTLSISNIFHNYGTGFTIVDSTHLVLYGRTDFSVKSLQLPEAIVSPDTGFLFSHSEVPEVLQATDTEQLRGSRIDRFQGIGDINGDGFDDMLVFLSPERLIVRGGGRTTPTWLSLEWGDWETTGDQVFGSIKRYYPDQQVVGLGDVDGDNLDDIAIRHFYSLPGQYPNGDSRIILLYGNTVFTATEAAPNYHVKNELSVIDASGAWPIALGDVDGDSIADLGLSTTTMAVPTIHPGYTPEFSPDGTYNVIVSLDTRNSTFSYNETTFQILSAPGTQSMMSVPESTPPLGPPEAYFVDNDLLAHTVQTINDLYENPPTEENPLDWSFLDVETENSELRSLTLAWFGESDLISRFIGAHNVIEYLSPIHI